MNEVYTFLEDIAHQDIKLWVEGEQLRCNAPKDRLTPTIVQQLQRYKPEILTILRQPQAQNASSTIPPADRSRKIPLSFTQQRWWLLDQLQPEQAAYNSPRAFRLGGPLSVPALQQALQEIVHRHESLRTTFVAIDGEMCQVVNPPPTLMLPLHDLRALDATTREAKLRDLMVSHARHTFDFTRDLMLQAALVCLTAQESVLLLTLHHAAFEGWSESVFWQELTQLYAVYRHGHPSPLPSLPIQYVDYTVWQQRWMKSEQAQAQLHYWQQQLAAAPPFLDLPIARLPASKPSALGEKQTFTLPASMLAQLQHFAQAEYATLFMVMLTAFKILLYRYTGQEDLIVGSPTAGRNQLETEGLIGAFLNNLVLRTQLHGQLTVRETIAQVREVTLNAYANQDLPFEALLQALQPERSLTHTPFFQILFVYKNTPPRVLALDELTIEPLSIPSEKANFNLTLHLTQHADHIRAVVEYKTALFDTATIHRLISHYLTILHGMIADPARCISALPLLSPVERQQILLDWNQTQVKHPLDKNLIDLFAEQVAQRPQATAFLTDDATLTYGELDQRSDRLAAHLRAAGIAKGMIVGVCLPRSFDAVGALLAIFKVGAIYLPLDPAYPRERLAFMLADAQAAIVITTTQLQPTLPADTTRLICIDNLDNLPVSLSPCHLVTLSPCHPDDPAYLIYTSGSTGHPKGAIVPHRQILNRLWWMWRKYPFQPDEMSCQKTALNFVDSLWELLGPLLQGSPTVILPDDVVRDPQQLIQSLARHGVTRLWLVPTLLRAMLQSTPELGNSLPKLCFLVTSGETLPTELFQQAKVKLPRATLYNLYGTSEVWDATWYDPTEHPLETKAGATVPIGKPIDNVQSYILDAQQQPVPIGVTGELYIGGVGLADGYLNRPELTDLRFWILDFGLTDDEVGTNPKSKIQNPKLYRTGDLARYLSDGTIEFMGRADFQVKLRGFRIELGEIEAVLNQHASVNQSVVVLRENEAADQQLAAYIVAMPDTDLTAASLRQFLTEQLPAHMIPMTYTWVDKLPLTPSGKVNRQALPSPASAPTPINAALTPARDELEMQLVQIWQKTLRVHPLGIYDNFFEVGGHSLLAVTLFDRIAKATGKTLPLRILLQSPTIAQQAAILRQQAWQPSWSSLAAVRAGGTKPPVFLVPPMRGTALSFTKLARHLDPDQPIYAFDPVGLDGTTTPLPTVEAMAAHYLREMTLFQPEGPYRLGGMCLGGMVAFEMARQLMDANQAVACLVLLDPGSPKNGPDWQWTPPQKTATYYGAQLIGHMKYGTFGRSFRYHWRRVQKMFGKQFSPLEILQQVQNTAIECYVAAPIGPPILLIQSEQFAAKPEHRSRWLTLAQGDLTYQVVPRTTHLSLMAKNDAHVALLAGHVQRYLNQFDATPLSCGCDEKRSCPSAIMQEQNAAFHTEQRIGANR